jgi:hypothetical protein
MDRLKSRALHLLLCCIFVMVFQCGNGLCQSVQRPPFRILVLGDSVMWGQGLKNEHKFSYRIGDWICARRHGSDRCEDTNDVEIHVEAHSGAVITPPLTANERKEEDKFIRTQSPTKYAGEVNHGYPTIGGEIELAQRYYGGNSVPLTEINLIFVNGGINDMGATRILLPHVGGNIEQYANRYCRDQMSILLYRLATTFPNARIIIPGYFPLVSLNTPEDILWETIGYLFLNKQDVGSEHGAIKEESEMASSPNPGKQSKIFKLLAKRSIQWVAASNTAFERAVNEFNSSHPIANDLVQSGESSKRAIFVPVLFEDDNAYAAPKTFLWQLVRKSPTVTFTCTTHDPLKNIMVSDEVQPDRPCMCDQAGKAHSTSCLRAAAFHPNKEGAERYFSTIKNKLEPILNSLGW